MSLNEGTALRNVILNPKLKPTKPALFLQSPLCECSYNYKIKQKHYTDEHQQWFILNIIRERLSIQRVDDFRLWLETGIIVNIMPLASTWKIRALNLQIGFAARKISQ